MKKLLMVLAIVSSQAFAMDKSQIEKYAEIAGPALECSYLYQITRQEENVQRMYILAYDRIRLAMPVFLREMKKESINVPKHSAFDFNNKDYWTGWFLGSLGQEAENRMQHVIFSGVDDYKFIAKMEIQKRNCDFIR